MAVPRDAIRNLQMQALEAIRNGQETAEERFRAWSDAVATMSPQEMRSLGDHLPVVGDTLGEATAIVDSVYDFAAEVLTLNKEFVHRLLEASAIREHSETPAT
jgi:hypothetical protein